MQESINIPLNNYAMNRIGNIEGMRSHFPALGQQVHGKDLVYFDNGATAQKPQSVISLINEMNSGTNGNMLKRKERFGHNERLLVLLDI